MKTKAFSAFVVKESGAVEIIYYRFSFSNCPQYKKHKKVRCFVLNELTFLSVNDQFVEILKQILITKWVTLFSFPSLL